MCHVAEGEAGGSKLSPDLPACVSLSKCPESWQTGYLVTEGNIARGNSTF